jgi:predicted DNA-binding transcriptional regulator YafY
LNTLKSATSHGLTPSAQTDIKTLVALYEAIGRRQKVHIHYFSASSGEYGERIIHPYHVLETRGEKILLAWDEKRDAIRNFNVARISKLTRLDAHFLMHEKFDAEQTIANMFFAESGEQTYTVVVAFDEYQTRYIRERHWHAHEDHHIKPDGSSTLTFPASGLKEVARWVLGYGQHAQVLEPPELRVLMAEHIRNMSGMYEAKNDPAD